MSEETSQENKKSKLNIKLLRGFKDIMPADEAYWHFVFKTVAHVAQSYDYHLIYTPILEESALFERTVGETSDIVSKEMFRFSLPKGDDEEGGKEVVLRPEGTAPVMRSYIEHGMLNRPQPVKLWYFGPMFRYDKPQSGRYRQFNQWGLEIIGDDSPIVDAQVIIAMHSIYKALGLDVVIAINSIGNLACRKAYTEALRQYFEPQSKHLTADQKKTLKANPLRLLDSKDENMQELIEEAPQIVDYLDEESRNHFIAVLEFLDELDVPYALHPRLVRGLDYYSRTTFEIFLKSEYENGSKLNALGGGGRYDGLSEQLGGRATPAVGAAAGVERVILALKDQQAAIPPVNKYDVFIAQLGPEARKKSLTLIEKLRQDGWSVGESLSKDGLSAQLERANKLGAQFTLILGQKEILEGTVIIRDMSSGIQEEVVFEKINDELSKRIKKVRVVKNGFGIPIDPAHAMPMNNNNENDDEMDDTFDESDESLEDELRKEVTEE